MMNNKIQPDSWLVITAIMLSFLGTILIFSTSAYFAEIRYDNSYYFLMKRFLHVIVGALACLVGFLIPYHQWKRKTPMMMLVMLVLLVLVLLPGIGHEVNGGRRWLRFFGLSVQPSEILKFVLIFYVASYLERKQEVMTSFLKGLTPNFIVTGAYLFLVLFQRDLGTTVLLSLTVLLMIYIGGARPIHVATSVGAFGVLLVLLIFTQEYRLRRLMTFLDPWADPLNAGFQIIQSFYAISLGGWSGQGLGESRQKLLFLPEAHTDFIFAILGEEFGFLGICAVVLLFAVFLWRGFRISSLASDSFGRNVAFGITCLLGLQITLNLFVVTGLTPTKGLPLPFISFGGTSFVATLFMTGILLNISRTHSQPQELSPSSMRRNHNEE